MNRETGKEIIHVEIKDQYYNMKDKLGDAMFLVDNAKLAMEDIGIIPKIRPIRGGTDGAKLSYMGLPCPNLCAGGHNFHGRYEYICIQSMEKIVELLVKLISI
jgi:tripeptide aminopeptidase